MSWVSDMFSGADDFVQGASNDLSNLDQTVNDEIPGGWATVAVVATGGAYAAGLLGTEAAAGAALVTEDMAGVDAAVAAQSSSTTSAGLGSSVSLADFVTGGTVFDEFAGVDAAVSANSATSAASTVTGAELPELLAASNGGFSLSASEISKGFSLVNSASGVVQKLNSAGKVVAQSRPATINVFGATPSGTALTASGLMNATAADNAATAAAVDASPSGSSSLFLPLMAAGALFFMR